MKSEIRELMLSYAIIVPVIAVVIALSWLLRDWLGEVPAFLIMCIACWLTGYKFLPWVAEKTARWF